MSLIRAPLIFTSAIWFHIINTPPNAPPPEKERVGNTGVEALLTRVVRAIPYISKIAVAAASACEIAVIVAQQFPSNSFAMQILSLLMHTPQNLHAAQRIHVTNIFFIGFLLANLGGFIRLTCFLTLGKLFTFELAVRKDHQLVTTGPYAVVRHPGYTGGFVVMYGVLLCHCSAGSWLKESGVMENGVVRGLVVMWVALGIAFQGMILVRVKKEDDVLRAAFGKSWDIWARRVKYRLLPGVY